MSGESKGRFMFCEALPPEPCQLCGKHKELRPYGPGGIYVCFQCAFKDDRAKKTTEAAFQARLDGAAA